MLARVILAIDDPETREKLEQVLDQPDLIVNSIGELDHLMERIGHESADLIVVSRSLIPEPLAKTVPMLTDLPDDPDILIISDREDPEERAVLLAAGCGAVLHAHLPPETLKDVFQSILKRRAGLASKGLLPRAALAEPRLTDFVSYSPAMRTFMNTVQRVVASDVSLLILGETGVGKERLARAIHAEGPRSPGPFVAINCGALPETLLESELFGHREGAFTGAVRDRRGMFELAHRGTVFLDEIGEMPLHLQVKLLRVLQEHQIQRLGGERAIEIDVRVMAASNRDLEAEVAAKRFRRDLYYRLGVVSLTIPPLRERHEDIPALVESYLEYLRPRVGRHVTGIADEALGALAQYPWPGNVRELINVIERAMLLSNEGRITLADLPEAMSGRSRLALVPMLSPAGPEQAAEVPPQWLERPLREVREAVLADFERAYLASLLRATGGRVGETAKRAGIQPRSLFDKMKRCGLRKEDFRRRSTSAK